MRIPCGYQSEGCKALAAAVFYVPASNTCLALCANHGEQLAMDHWGLIVRVVDLPLPIAVTAVDRAVELVVSQAEVLKVLGYEEVLGYG